MKFVDEATIELFAGHGGPGAVSFRREKYVPRGGPDGGDGGKGGSVIITAHSQLSTLQDFRYKRKYRAPDGEAGKGAQKTGRDGEDLHISIPVGTLVKDAETGERLVDFREANQTWVAAKGGRGGKGNSHFATATFQAPRFSQPGEEGESLRVTLELKLLADVGIVGFPNAGKSTLVSVVSAAKPKIANYPFTTLTPCLGVVELPGDRSAVFADIPGLVEGAHKGVGLGHRFLKHIERTRVLIHLLDGAELLERDPSELLEILESKYRTIREELYKFDEGISQKPEIVALNKSDLLDAELANRLTAELGRKISKKVLLVSSGTRSGVQDLLNEVTRELE